MTQSVWNNALSILHVVAGGTCCIGLIIVWYKFYVQHNNIGNKWVLIYSILAISMFGISSFAISIYFANLIKGFALYIVIDVWEFCQAFGHAFTYILFIKRIKITFNNTKYQYSPYIYIILYVLIIIFICIQLFHILVNYTFYSNIDKSMNIISTVSVSEYEYNITRLCTIWSSAFMDLILCILFLTLLFHKLWILTVDMEFVGMREPEKLKWAQSASNNDTQSIAINDLSLNQQQTKIINGIAKITVLSIFSVISAQILILWLGIMFTTQNSSSFTYWMTYLPFRAITNMLCIMLSFEFMNKWYLKICGLCDDCCYLCCESITKYKLKNSIKNELKLTLLSHHNDL